MKKIWIVILCILIYTLYQHRERIFFSDYHEEVPTEFKEYKSLLELASYKNSKCKFVHTYYQNFGRIYGDSLIWIAKHNKDISSYGRYLSTYYKIDYKGIMTDSLVTRIDFDDIHNYLININESYYITWLINGDTIRKPFNKISVNRPLDFDELRTYFDGAEYISRPKLINDDSEKELKKIVFFKNDNWYEVTTNTEKYISEVYNNRNFFDFKRLNSVGKIQYKKKKNHIKYSSSYNPHGSQSSHWKGDVYYNIISNKDTFKFKETYVRIEDDYVGSEFEVYENTYGHYILFHDHEPGDHNFYIVRF